MHAPSGSYFYFHPFSLVGRSCRDAGLQPDPISMIYHQRGYTRSLSSLLSRRCLRCLLPPVSYICCCCLLSMYVLPRPLGLLFSFLMFLILSHYTSCRMSTVRIRPAELLHPLALVGALFYIYATAHNTSPSCLCFGCSYNTYPFNLPYIELTAARFAVHLIVHSRGAIAHRHLCLLL